MGNAEREKNNILLQKFLIFKKSDWSPNIKLNAMRIKKKIQYSYWMRSCDVQIQVMSRMKPTREEEEEDMTRRYMENEIKLN